MNSTTSDSTMRHRRRLTLLHTSDLHLGSDVYPDDKLRGLDEVLALARERRVDAILIAGDLFDAYTVPRDTVSYAVEALGRLGRPVIILPGNHDTLLTRRLLSLDGLPHNLHLLLEASGRLVTIPEMGLSVWGRPVYEHEPAFHPLEGLQPRPDNGWYVAMAHGLFIERKGSPASPITEEELVQADRDYVARGGGLSSPVTWMELVRADCDYIALGHVHVFRDVTQGESPAFYSGAPSGMRDSGAVLVTLDPEQGVSVEHHKTSWFPQ